VSWPAITAVILAAIFGGGYGLLILWAARTEQSHRDGPPAGGTARVACTCGASITASLADVHGFIASHETGPGHHLALELPGDDGEPS
jgi:hypothetical protein